MERDPIKLSAKIFSSVFSPLLMPTYGIALALNLTILQITPLTTRIGIIAIILILTAIIPAVLIRSLSTFKLIKDSELSQRSDRFIPFLVTLLLYISTSIYLFLANAPSWLYGFMLGASVALAITVVVNRWWKISAHATAIGGLVALSIVLSMLPDMPLSMVWLVASTFLAAGITCTARLILQCHTPAQVYLGFANGFINILIWSLL